MITSHIQSHREAVQVNFPCYKSYSKGQVIYKQDQPSYGFFLVKSGSIKLQKMLSNGTLTIQKIATEGDVIGEGEPDSLIHRKNLCYAIALEDGTMIQKIDDSASLSPEVKSQLTQKLIDRAVEASLRHERLISLDAEQRIKSILKELALKIGHKYGEETLLKINLTHEEFALLSDSSRQTVTKTLSALKRQGMINYSRNRILFRNLQTFN
ncbi:CRP/FNR family transcriptional regulator, anaerobic regulatory protein [Algoriphagus locisalis]|uniref:CRP/FNR family transcriptional regulator, anaerobic regulatory protein n=1 Tax=Algoriphagus locisalis TaxID=305507 RepID=A0A1I6XH53_9BACT|nr:Crp/Fnr family transcriptional regulator [Algoriphagus locisalis]SFT37352.1 CRP/FNR family transcriptional regulator, anaerobic regulatory protein [Algoriphagus locisalis]